MKRGKKSKAHRQAAPKLRPPGPLPAVALVGRPNVGKSALFNRLIGEKRAIVHEKPGVTRDRLYGTCNREDYWFDVIDTGGLEVGKARSEYADLIRRQVEIAIEEAEAIVFITEAPYGIVAEDPDIADMLRKSGKPVVLVANKSDLGHDGVDELAGLGLGTPLLVTAKYGEGIRRLLSELIELLDLQPWEQPELSASPTEADSTDFEVHIEPRPEELGLALIGRPNVGKSALFNRLIKQERSLVAPIPGTTRDALDSVVELDGRKYRFLDTAGLRKRSKVKEDLEYYSVLRARKALERASVALLVLDAQEGVTSQDQRLAGFAEELGRAVIILANKWDLVKARVRKSLEEELEAGEVSPEEFKLRFDQRLNQLRRDLSQDFRRRLKFLEYAPLVFTSAVEGTGLKSLPELIETVRSQYETRLGTGVLNRWLQEALLDKPPRMRGTRIPKFYYVTQPVTRPPTLVIFVNDPDLVHFSYKRYLVNSFRERFGLDKTPVRCFFRPRPRRQRKQ